jgi:hypothetical protein
LNVDVRELDFTARVLSDSSLVPLGVPFLVVAAPDDSVRAERGMLYYRMVGTADFDSLALTRLGSDFLAAVPAAKVTERGVEYYVRLQNGDYFGTRPVGAPATAPYPQEVARPDSIHAVARPTSGLEGDSVEVEVDLQTGTVFQRGTIYFRSGGAIAEQSDTLKMGPLNRPIGVIPRSVVGPTGVEYRVEVATLRDTLRFPSSGKTYEWIPTRVRNLAEAFAHPKLRYRLLSIPLELPQVSLEDILYDQFGAYDPVNWRAFVYDPLVGGNVEFSSGDQRFQPVPGRGFWLISRDANTVDTKPIDGLSPNATTDYRIDLAAGWNIVGNPFDFPVEWDSVRCDRSVVGAPIMFDPNIEPKGEYSGTASVLVPFEGYFIHASQAATLFVPRTRFRQYRSSFHDRAPHRKAVRAASGSRPGTTRPATRLTSSGWLRARRAASIGRTSRSFLDHRVRGCASISPTPNGARAPTPIKRT